MSYPYLLLLHTKCRYFNFGQIPIIINIRHKKISIQQSDKKNIVGFS